MSKNLKGAGLLIIFLIFGSILGSIIGEVLSPFFPLINYGENVGLSPTTFDLSAISVTFGVSMDLNLATILGFFVALFIYARL